METIDQTNEVQRPKTYFEEVIGWIFIILGGFGVLSGLISILFFGGDSLTMGVDNPEIQEVLEEMPVFGMLTEYSQLYTYFNFVFSVLTCVFSYGLLQKLEWSRVGFILVMVVNCLMMMGAIWFMHVFISEMIRFIGEQESDADMNVVSNIFNVIVIIADVIIVAFMGLYFWIAYRLSTPTVKARFN